MRKKILLSITLLLLLFGFATILITRAVLLKVLKTEFQHKGLSYARSIAANSVVDILTQNNSRLKKLLENEKTQDPDIAYLFIAGSSGQILAHTFSKGFPTDLAKANPIEGDKDFNIQLLDTQLGLIYDVAVPIFLEKSILGYARVGILQNSIQRTINSINLVFIGIMLFLMFIGILLAYRVSSLITRPISKLVEGAQLIQRGNFSTKIDVKSGDEIGLLASTFNEMVVRLNLMIEEMKRLTLIKERNRVALDLHDGCAQDLANIIKRLELCKKLFRIDPAEAQEELDILKENAKETLNRTRQVIFDLKSSEDEGFDLINKLASFIKDYQMRNEMTVKLDISDTINNILSEKARAIFYIIREAFNNIEKHSRAKNVILRLELKSDNSLRIFIKDDGRGFDSNQTDSSASGCGKWGLINMRQRTASLGGALEIISMPNQGTEVSVNIPLEEKA